jgi:tetratricopeptide (TPR) repeat protein
MQTVDALISLIRASQDREALEMLSVCPLLAIGHSEEQGQLHGASPLHWAAHRNAVDLCERLIQLGANVNDSSTHWWRTPLAWAADAASAEAVELLLKHGADVSQDAVVGTSALHAAAMGGSSRGSRDPEAYGRTAEILIAHGADVNRRATGDRGQTPLDDAIANINDQVAAVLRKPALRFRIRRLNAVHNVKDHPSNPETHNRLGLDLARQHQLDAALRHFEQALRLNPEYAEAHNNLGLVHYLQGNSEKAIICYRAALRINPIYPEAHHNLGLALLGLGRLDEAASSERQALALRPALVEAHNCLGLVLRRQGKLLDALGCFRTAIAHRPAYAEAHFNLGLTFTDLHDLAEAARGFQQACQCRPDWPEAHFQLSNALARLGRKEQAIAGYRRALALRPGYGDAYNNLAVLLTELGKLDEAVSCFAQGLMHCPGSAELHNNLGAALAKEDKFDEATACYRQALAHRPDYAEAHSNLGGALVGLGKHHEALASYERALELDPNQAASHVSLGETRLAVGDFEHGWPEMEWRWQAAHMPRPSFSQPAWDGSPLNGRTILVYAEQGFGDTFQFVRYLPLVKERGGIVVFQCQKHLLRILSGCPGIDRLLPAGAELPPFDVHAALLSLPGIFKTTLSTVPYRVPYLSADPALVEAWRGPLSGIREFKVGIAWQGSATYEGDRLRSVPLAAFEPLARVEGVRLVSLQKGEGVQQLAELQGRFPVTDLGDRLDVAAGPFMDTAAVMMNLDLVISSDTAVPHLAGALGVPVWVALAFAADWRWLVDRDDVPWYPSMRLFRQRRLGDWQELFARFAEALREQVIETASP